MNRCFCHIVLVRPPGTGEFVLSTAQNLIVENDDAPHSFRRHPSRGEVMAEICAQLDAFRADDAQVIRGATVISKDLSIDSLAVMDMIMELEDRFDVTIPMNVSAGIDTIDQLAEAVVHQRTHR